jgi:Amt family ammonium transporter
MSFTQEQVEILQNLNLTFVSDAIAQSKLDFAAGIKTTNGTVDTLFVLLSGYLVFFMQAGFAMLCAGSVRSKNVKNIMLKNFLDACFGAIGFWAIGYALAYGGGRNGNAFFGTDLFFLVGYEETDGFHSWFFQFAFAATAATIVSGAVAERTQMTAYLLYALFLTGFVYPIVAHWIWSGNGWLSAFNKDAVFKVIDFAGCGVVHMTGGISALIGAWAVGPRVGRFGSDGSVNTIPGHNAALAVLGTFILWFGWYGFNPGSMLAIGGGASKVVSKSAVTTTLSAVGGGMTALFYYHSTTTHWDLGLSLNGALAGLVGITSACSTVEPWAALVIGSIAAVIYALSSKMVSHVFKIDDVVDAAPVHLFCGMWGLIAPGLFATPANLKAAYNLDTGYGLFYGGGISTLFGQVVAILMILIWTIVLMTPFFIILSKFNVLRISEDDEMVGLDVSHHGGSAYPEMKTIREDGTEAEKKNVLTAV